MKASSSRTWRRHHQKHSILYAAVAALFSCVVASIASAAPSDPFLWLEQLHGARALAWVKAEDAKTLAVLRKDPRFNGFYRKALTINEAKDRVAYPTLVNGRVYNFWQDRNHVRGIWRTTTIADYANAQPAWTTVVDLDALARAEGKNWIWQGYDCDSPGRRRCLVSLSDGGEDAVTVREFDLRSRTFVKGGFELPRGKQDVSWLDDDTLLASREWRPGDVTASGYAYIVKTLKRGQPLSGAREIYRGTKHDVSAAPLVLVDSDGHRFAGIERGVSFFESEKYIRTRAGLRRLHVPAKSSLVKLFHGRLLLRLDQAWFVKGRTYRQGSLVSFRLASALADPSHLDPSIVYVPGPRESLEQVTCTRERVILATLHNVQGQVHIYALDYYGSWLKHRAVLPPNSTTEIQAADNTGSTLYVRTTSFLQPSTLFQIDADTHAQNIIKQLPARFDASRDIVEQFESTSKDGTKIPYFIVHPKSIPHDGSTPTILAAYGGFQISETPYYDPVLGKLWLERGGAFALANIRGGGEFGPAWHEAGLKTHRQRIYDDFASVAKDLIARQITSPAHLGIQGGSNGGLLMGVEFTQHPELYKAVDIQVPLLDMLRYENIQAGASWVGEYGSVAVPRERAFLASISPYNNIRRGVRYPEPFIWTTTKDDRVGPQHARKFAARLKAMGIPYLFYEVVEGGHGSGANIKERSLTTVLEMTYFTRKLMQ